MNRDQLEGKGREALGGARQTAGDLTGNRELQARGTAQRTGAMLQVKLAVGGLPSAAPRRDRRIVGQLNRRTAQPLVDEPTGDTAGVTTVAVGGMLALGAQTRLLVCRRRWRGAIPRWHYASRRASQGRSGARLPCCLARAFETTPQNGSCRAPFFSPCGARGVDGGSPALTQAGESVTRLSTTHCR